MANHIDMAEMKERNRLAKMKALEEAHAKRMADKDSRLDVIENAGFVKARFSLKDGGEELVWLKVVKVLDDKVQGAVYRKPEKLTFRVGESVVVRFKDIIETKAKVNGPLDRDNLANHFPS